MFGDKWNAFNYYIIIWTFIFTGYHLYIVSSNYKKEISSEINLSHNKLAIKSLNNNNNNINEFINFWMIFYKIHYTYPSVTSPTNNDSLIATDNYNDTEYNYILSLTNSRRCDTSNDYINNIKLIQSLNVQSNLPPTFTSINIKKKPINHQSFQPTITAIKTTKTEEFEVFCNRINYNKFEYIFEFVYIDNTMDILEIKQIN